MDIGRWVMSNATWAFEGERSQLSTCIPMSIALNVEWNKCALHKLNGSRVGQLQWRWIKFNGMS